MVWRIVICICALFVRHIDKCSENGRPTVGARNAGPHLGMPLAEALDVAMLERDERSLAVRLEQDFNLGDESRNRIDSRLPAAS